MEVLQERLQVMVDIDQLARGATLAARPGQPSRWTPQQRQALMQQLSVLMREVDAAHHPVLVDLLQTHNPFSISTFGEQTARNAWLLVQHADQHPELQHKALGMMRSLPPDDVHGQNLAYLEDRVATAADRPQRYGTQGRCVPGQGWQPFELVDAAKVDDFRAEVGLDSLAQHRALFTGQCD